MTTTFDSGSASAVTLSNGNLTATNTGTSSTNQGAKAIDAKTTGKWYFEVTLTTIVGLGGSNLGFGVATDASTYTNIGNNATTGTMIYLSGNIYANGSSSGLSLGPLTQGTVIGLAVDLTNHLAWFRVAPSGNWNNQVIGSENPVGAVGGVAVTSAAGVEPFVVFGDGNGTAGNAQTANFAGVFSGSVPSGFTSWEPHLATIIYRTSLSPLGTRGGSRQTMRE